MKTLEELIKDNDWISISCYKYLTEEFIEKYSNKVHWHHVSAYKKLSEKFIEKYSDKVYWEYISIYQTLSKEFILKHSDKFNENYLSHDIIFDENKEYNICNKCNCSDYNLHDMSCNEVIMNRVLK